MNPFKKKDLAVVEKKEIMPPVTEQTVTDYMKAFGLAGNLQDNEVEAFKQMAVMHNLNPFNREIYCSAYGTGDYRTLSIVTGYEVYIRKAEQSGLMEYWVIDDAPPETPIEKYWCKLIVKRTDKTREQAWTTYYSEAVQKKNNGEVNAFWKKQPRMMTRKVAMSQGFRLFFEDVMHGIPYTREEMPEEKGGMTDVTPQPKAKKITEMNKREMLSAMENNYEKATEKASQQREPEVPDNQPEPTTEPPVKPVSGFSAIIALANTGTMPAIENVKMIAEARDCKGDEEKLASLLKAKKEEFGV